jgi:hypothetical protein
VCDALRTLARGERVADDGVRGWWDRDDRVRSLAELLAARDAQLPEGDHVLI